MQAFWKQKEEFNGTSQLVSITQLQPNNKDFVTSSPGGVVFFHMQRCCEAQEQKLSLTISILGCAIV